MKEKFSESKSESEFKDRILDEMRESHGKELPEHKKIGIWFGHYQDRLLILQRNLITMRKEKLNLLCLSPEIKLRKRILKEKGMKAILD